MRTLLVLTTLLAACSGSDDGDSSSTTDEKTPKATATISSPSPGDTFTEGDTVHLLVTGTVGGKAAEVKHADWSTDGWTMSGNDIDVTDLPPGALTLSVEALIDGQTVTTTVDITVEEKPKGPEQVSYAGAFNAQIVVSTNDFDVDGPCNGSVALTAHRDAETLEGTGRCSWQTDFGDLDFEFLIDGGWTTGSLAGDLVLVYEGQEYRTPYTGTGAYNAALRADYDETTTTADGSIRIAGNWTADPS